MRVASARKRRSAQQQGEFARRLPPSRRSGTLRTQSVSSTELNRMGDFVQLIVSGTATGAIYALAALGFTLLWQAAGVINFAQGEFVMLPAFAMLFFMALGAPLWLSFLLTCAIASIVLGAGFKRLIVDPLIKHGVIPLVIATLGLSIAVKSAVRAGYSAEAHPFPSPFPAGQLSLAGINVSYADIGTLVLAGAIVIGLQAFINK